MERPNAAASLSQLLDGLDSKTRNQAIDATFVPAAASVGEPSMDSLPRLTLVDGVASAPELAIQEKLGEGGRGEVHQARQLSLRRAVAVKSLKDGSLGAHTAELLREARITGALEHPNIVPVYALGRDAQDRVLLVMKQVHGEPWGAQLRAQVAPRTPAQLDAHLEVFRQVCNAVAFAHSQGVIHRDLKPDNVMVGAFGEVVVLDWGLAASLQGDAERGIPPAASLRGLAGTPSYMAPEGVSGDGAQLGFFTDVYLLGATLHEVLTGQPPHRGESLSQVLERALASAPPVYAPGVPEELAEICRRAMHVDPAARYESVAALRDAVVDFGRHRQSRELAREAQRRIDALPAWDHVVDAERATAAHGSLAQARFGFEQALRTWPENASAQAGLTQVMEQVVRLEVSLGNLAGAVRALAELAAPPPALAAAVEALRERVAREQAELRALRVQRRELDVEDSSAARNLLLGVCALLWCLLPLGADVLARRGVFAVTPRASLISVGIFVSTVALGFWGGRETLLRNRIGRRIAVAMGLVVVGTALTRLEAYLLHESTYMALAPEMLAYGLTSALAATFVDVRFAGAAVVYWISSVAAAAYPAQALRIIAAANLIALLPTAMLWNRLGRYGCEELGGAEPAGEPRPGR